MSEVHRKVSPPKLLLLPKRPTGEEIQKDDPSLPEKIKELVRADRVHKIIHYAKTEGLFECFMVHMNEFLSDYNCYELFYIKE